MNAQYAPCIRIHIHHRIQQLVRGYLVPILHRVDKRKKANLLTPLLTLRAMALDHPTSPSHQAGQGQGLGLGQGQSSSSSSSSSTTFDDTDYKAYSRKHGIVTVDHPLQTTIGSSPHTHTQIYTLREQILAICDDKSLYRQKGGLLSMSMSSSSKPDIEKEDLACFESFYAVGRLIPLSHPFSYTRPLTSSRTPYHSLSHTTSHPPSRIPSHTCLRSTHCSFLPFASLLPLLSSLPLLPPPSSHPLSSHPTTPSTPLYLQESFYYPYLLDLDGTIKRCGDLSYLWFRESHLETTRSVQVPIESSLPWILAGAPHYRHPLLTHPVDTLY